MRIIPDVPDDADTGGWWLLRAQLTVKVPRLTIHHIYTKHQSSTSTRAQDTPGCPPVSSPGPRSDQDSARVAVEVYFTGPDRVRSSSTGLHRHQRNHNSQEPAGHG